MLCSQTTFPFLKLTEKHDEHKNEGTLNTFRFVEVFKKTFMSAMPQI